MHPPLDLPPSLAQALALYADGWFPMARSRDDPDYRWYKTFERGIIPLETFHTPRKLRSLLRRAPFTLRRNSDFAAVITACAAARQDTWINPKIIALSTQLHQAGTAHSFECWLDERLVGGLYGVAVGGAFIGESMFSLVKDASKVALCTLVQELRARGFTLLDTQTHTPHLAQFGAITISQEDFAHRLAQARAHRPYPLG